MVILKRAITMIFVLANFMSLCFKIILLAHKIRATPGSQLIFHPTPHTGTVCHPCVTGESWISSGFCLTAVPTCWLCATLWPGNWPDQKPCSGDHNTLISSILNLQYDIYTWTADLVSSFKGATSILWEICIVYTGVKLNNHIYILLSAYFWKMCPWAALHFCSTLTKLCGYLTSPTISANDSADRLANVVMSKPIGKQICSA